MTEIKSEEAEWMYVWDNNYRYGKKRLVIAKRGEKYLAIKDEDKDSFRQSKNYFYVKVWKHAEPIKKILTVVVKSAEEITGIKGICSFDNTVYGCNDKRTYHFTTEMNGLADKRIKIKSTFDFYYDYNHEGAGFKWLKGWLKDFREEEE